MWEERGDNPRDAIERLRIPDPEMSAAFKRPMKVIPVKRIGEAVDKVDQMWYNILCKFYISRTMYSTIRQRVHRHNMTLGEVIVGLMQDEEDLTIDRILEIFHKHEMWDAKTRLQHLQGDAVLFREFVLYQSHQMAPFLMDDQGKQLVDGWEELLADLGLERHFKHLRKYPYLYGEDVLLLYCISFHSIR